MKRAPSADPPPLDLFFGGPLPATAAPPPARRPRAPGRLVPPPIAVGPSVDRVPTCQRWHEVAAECPEGRSAAAHCWPVDGIGWAHVVTDVGILCVPGEMCAGPQILPVGGLLVGQRTSDAQRLGELGGRY